MRRAKTVPEAAEIIGVSVRTYYAAAARGEVPAVRIGRRVVVPDLALERFLASSDDAGGLAEREAGRSVLS
jgi:excisionase family DNA binding protein